MQLIEFVFANNLDLRQVKIKAVTTRHAMFLAAKELGLNISNMILLNNIEFKKVA